MKTLTFYRLLVFVVILNTILFIYFLILQNTRGQSFSGLGNFDHNDYVEEVHDSMDANVVVNKNISILITFLIRDYGDFENSLDTTITNLKNIKESFNIIVIGDNIIYPPIKANFNLDNTLHFVAYKTELDDMHPIECIRKLIKTPYVMFLPDGAKLKNAEVLLKMVENFESRKLISMLATKVGEEDLTCPGLSVDKRKWTVKLSPFDGSDGMCDYVGGDQAILIKTQLLWQLSQPFGRPVPLSLYSQTALRHMKVGIFREKVFVPRKSWKDFESEWKYKKQEEKRTELLMKGFGIKHLLYAGNSLKLINFGCDKNSERCFGTVENDTPDFIYEGKWTPPCCLNALRETTRHVLKLLTESNVRYWLEGGSLLGAARNGDIIPWDYDVDIGIYKTDVNNSFELKKLLNAGSFIDDYGFLWEKAREGDFYRVHYSDVNRNHIDIFPFYSKNGIMTKDTWFKTHRQDMEFPEHFLKPLTFISFIGMNVSAPNNIRKFLELKFGEGVIESPKYPNSQNVIG